MTLQINHLLSDIKQFALLQWTKLRNEASLTCRGWHPNPHSGAAGVSDVVLGSVIFVGGLVPNSLAEAHTKLDKGPPRYQQLTSSKKEGRLMLFRVAGAESRISVTFP